MSSRIVLYLGWNKGLFIKNQPIVSLPNVSHGKHDDEMRRGLRLLTVSDGVEVEKAEGPSDVMYVYGGPKQFSDNILPH